ncbi:hypothetical protein PFICI_03809 [Pestalotiopsis fici W106-1]|uniref:Xylanolytic transcriptional activator regulatory domain-containing protein n=1 Tax=Pestalotiopsis fici (strain W106-1 / CGMCC3.15140) TaxID=1229662 RepID=W3XIG5_PESFW|nr:uncharacterized protein PFICI_03809 [Pestalotiopsis fici W106-1]ETS85784.1 hypothetical protein PFICI_03809 [Pestalotiopsis fici W106-1]
MLVEYKAAPSEFTQDPQRHMIVEAPSNPLPSNTPMCLLPDIKTASILVNSYFINTIGFVEVFDRRIFRDQFDQCFQDPLTIDPSVRCLLNLVFAIGLVLAKPEPESEEEEVIKKLREHKGINHAEVFFRNAKALADPESGFENANIWSVQALCLMAIYMLSVSKRNAAYAYYGMAVRSAFALGLHREENDCSFDRIFDQTLGKVRRNLWRTLYVLDRFLSASLGRPMAISDEDCSEDPLEAGEKPLESEDEKVNSAALYAAVRTSRVIGKTLKEVYSKRKISCAITQEIAKKLVDWNGALHTELHWQQAKNNNVPRSRRITILHVNLLQCHSIILLARPFFLYILKVGMMQGSQARLSQRMDGYAQTCVEAAQHSLAIAQAAMDGDYLPHCNPFVIYFVFAAGLIILSNEFASLYINPDADMAVASCLSILGYCAEHDPQAKRVHHIIKTFQEVIVNRASAEPVLSFPGRIIPTITPASSNPHHDPMAHFFKNSKCGSKAQQLPIMPPTLRPEHSSMSASYQRRPSSSIISVHQQPSPDGTDGSPAAVVSASGSDGNTNPDVSFFLDDLFTSPYMNSNARMQMDHQQHIQPETFNNHYTLGPTPSLPFGPASIPPATMPPVSMGPHGNLFYSVGDNF